MNFYNIVYGALQEVLFSGSSAVTNYQELMLTGMTTCYVLMSYFAPFYVIKKIFF